MSFSDMLSIFKWIHRTRLFDSRWTVVSAWTSANISWVSGFLRKKFRIEIGKAGTVVVVLSQLDDRYFVGLEGQYYFELQFVLQREGGEHICGARQVHKWENRSISCEVDLEPGVYEVVPKITASRRGDGSRTVEQMVRKYAEENPQKLRQVGMQYDLAHAKPGVLDYDQELEEKKEKKKKKEEERNKKAKERVKKERERRRKAARMERLRQKKLRERQRKAREKAKKAAEKEAEEKRKRNEARQKRREEKAKKKEEEKIHDGEDAKPTETDPKAGDPTESAAGVDPKTDAPASAPEASQEKDAGQPEDGTTPGTSPSEVSELSAEDSEAPKMPDPTGAPSAPASDVSDDEEISSISSLSEIETDDFFSEASETESESESESGSGRDIPRVIPPPPIGQPQQNQQAPSTPPWNPVCVLGLRVYALDPDVSVKLVDEKDEKEDGKQSQKEDGEPVGETS